MDRFILGIVSAVIALIAALYYSNQKLKVKIIVQKEKLDDEKIEADIKHLPDDELDSRLSKNLRD